MKKSRKMTCLRHRWFSMFSMFISMAMVLMLIDFPGITPIYAGEEKSEAIVNGFVATTSVENDTGLPSSLKNGQVWSGKQVKDNGDGSFNITLSALGRNFETTSTNGKQYDIVFVLDYSGSMNDNNKGTSMIKAANSAIKELLNNNSKNMYNRISVVQFSESAGIVTRWTNNKDYKIEGGTFKGGTNIMAGMNVGNTMLSSRRTDATPVMIVLSDGVPCYYYTDTVNNQTGEFIDDGSGTAEDTPVQALYYTVKRANNIKSGIDGLKVYTIGFSVPEFGSATLNPTNVYAIENGTIDRKTNQTFAIFDSSAILQQQYNCKFKDGKKVSGIISSKMNNYTDKYFSGGISEINNIFEQIVEEMIPTSPIKDNLIIKDCIGNGFEISGELPAGTYFDNTSGSVIYTISKEKLKCLNSDTATTVNATPNSVTFKVKPVASMIPADTYYTNKNAVSTFTPSVGNPEYLEDKEQMVTFCSRGSIKLCGTNRSVIKIWEDNNNQDGNRTDSVNVVLKADGQIVKGTDVTLGDANKWEYSWKNLPIYKDGQKIVYTVAETSIQEGYRPEYSEKDGKIIVTNILIPKQTTPEETTPEETTPEETTPEETTPEETTPEETTPEETTPEETTPEETTLEETTPEETTLEETTPEETTPEETTPEETTPEETTPEETTPEETTPEETTPEKTTPEETTPEETTPEVILVEETTTKRPISPSTKQPETPKKIEISKQPDVTERHTLTKIIKKITIQEQPIIETTAVPQTGDSKSIWFAIAGVIAAGVAIILTKVLTDKKRKNRI